MAAIVLLIIATNLDSHSPEMPYDMVGIFMPATVEVNLAVVSGKSTATHYMPPKSRLVLNNSKQPAFPRSAPSSNASSPTQFSRPTGRAARAGRMEIRSPTAVQGLAPRASSSVRSPRERPSSSTTTARQRTSPTVTTPRAEALPTLRRGAPRPTMTSCGPVPGPSSREAWVDRRRVRTRLPTAVS